MSNKKNKYKRDSEYLFVDGYNILNQWESLKKYLAEDLERARIELMEILAEYAHITNTEVILVYDAYLVKKNPESEEDFKGIKVVFTKEFETADHYIERELFEIGRVRNVRVATSDYIEQQLILSKGGTRISARELEIEVFNAKNKVEDRAKQINLETKNYLNKLDDENIEKLEKIKKDLKHK